MSVSDPAHHGTSKNNAESILSTGFQPSVSLDSHLGEGVYFFDSNKEAAVAWAKHRKDANGAWAVVAATVQMGQCLDLCNNEHCRLVQRMAKEL